MFLFRCCVHQNPDPKSADSHEVLEVTATSVSRRVERAKEVRALSHITLQPCRLTYQLKALPAFSECDTALYRAQSQPQEAPSVLGLLLDALLSQATIQTMEERPWIIMTCSHLSSCVWLPDECAQNWTTCTRQRPNSPLAPCPPFLIKLYTILVMHMCLRRPANSTCCMHLEKGWCQSVPQMLCGW